MPVTARLQQQEDSVQEQTIEPNVTAGVSEAGNGTDGTMTPYPNSNEVKTPDLPPYRMKPRAGITTNKGHGVPKVKRRMAAASRRRNRR
jgi:hypothetical protein